jgi:hypothetical protein
MCIGMPSEPHMLCPDCSSSPAAPYYPPHQSPTGRHLQLDTLALPDAAITAALLTRHVYLAHALAAWADRHLLERSQRGPDRLHKLPSALTLRACAGGRASLDSVSLASLHANRRKGGLSRRSRMQQGRRCMGRLHGRVLRPAASGAVIYQFKPCVLTVQAVSLSTSSSLEHPNTASRKSSCRSCLHDRRTGNQAKQAESQPSSRHAWMCMPAVFSMQEPQRSSR